MADIKLSGYKAAATSIAWTTGQALDSLTDNETTDASDAIDNGTNLYALCDVELVLASAAFTGTDCRVEVFLLPSVDGTNYVDWDGNTATPGNTIYNYRVGSIAVTAATAAFRGSLRDVKLYNGLQKFAFRSRANVTLAASGNTAKYRPHQLQN